MVTREKMRLTYKVTDLATMLDLDARTVLRWLKRHDVPVERIGDQRARVVWLADLFAAFPQLEKSLELLRSAQEE